MAIGTLDMDKKLNLQRKREREEEAFEKQRTEIKNTFKNVSAFEDRFSGGNETVAKSNYVGLLTVEEFKKASENKKEVDDEKERLAKEKKDRKEKKKMLKEKRKRLSTLSFAVEEDEEDQQKVISKDTTIDTSFLPDADRDRELEMKRQKLEKEWKAEQEKAKNEDLEITFSYYDGAGHRRTITCRKGDSIGDFLEKARQNLAPDFRELGSVDADDLLYVKEDLIIPSYISFYDLIITKARGKSGPLFHFDVHDDVRVGAIDSRVLTDHSHPGKVCLRRWYEQHKHIFPASRWEIYDPAKTYGDSKRI